MKSLSAALEQRVSHLRMTQMLIVGLLLSGLGLSMALSFAFVRSITGPMREAVLIATAVADGNLTGEVKVRGSNELGQLMQACPT